MKSSLLAVAILALSLNVNASEEVRTYKQISTIEASVTIQTEETDGTQAAGYVDSKENAQFIKELFKNESGMLSQIKREIEQNICGENSKDETGYIEGCGAVTITNTLMTSFGRGGWASAGASYTFFIGFTSDGTGNFFDVSHMVTISESADAQINEDGEYSGVVIKTLTLDTVRKLETEKNEDLK